MRSVVCRVIVSYLVTFSILLGGQASAGQWPHIPHIPHIPKPSVLVNRAAEKAIGSVLNNELPIKLDATSLYPAVKQLPGGPFVPHHLEVTAETLVKPLPPGDYTVPVIAFCTEYSVHGPSYGTAYELGPLEGKDAEAVATLFWRGVFLGIDPHHLQAVSWAIQSGLPYGRMPRPFRQTIDELIPDYKSRLGGDFLGEVQDTYQRFARTSPGILPLQPLLGKLGKPGQLALSAEVQQGILLQENTNDQLKEQTLFVGQNTPGAAPVAPEEGPWTVAVPGVAYMRLLVVQGNLGTNTLEIRILPQTQPVSLLGGARLLGVAQTTSAAEPAAVTLLSLMGVRVSPQLSSALGRGVVIVAGGVLAPEDVLGLVAGGMIAYALHLATQALISVLSSLNTTGGNAPECQKATPYQLKSAGINNQHEFKEDEYQAKPSSRFDICACKDGSIVIKDVDMCGKPGGIWEVTHSRWK
jgi:hypothetical protein